MMMLHFLKISLQVKRDVAASKYIDLMSHKEDFGEAAYISLNEARGQELDRGHQHRRSNRPKMCVGGALVRWYVG